MSGFVLALLWANFFVGIAHLWQRDRAEQRRRDADFEKSLRPTADRDGEIIPPGAFDCEDCMRNPKFVWEHRQGVSARVDPGEGQDFTAESLFEIGEDGEFRFVNGQTDERNDQSPPN